MGLKVQYTDSGKWKLVFNNEPSYIHALDLSSKPMETNLNSGVWLIAIFCVASITDRNSLLAAITFAKGYAGKFQMGVQPYEFREEITEWWRWENLPTTQNVRVTVKGEPPSSHIHFSTDPLSSPIWLVLNEGKVIYHQNGPFSNEILRDIMQRVLKC